MPGRQYSAVGYRYGFNGKENDNEVKGVANQQDYGMRIYDPRLGKFLSTDPLLSKYPMLTPYQFSSNRPIDGIDLDGLEHLPSMISKIDVSVSAFSFNGQHYLTGAVFFDRNNVDRATRGWMDFGLAPEGSIGSPRSIIGIISAGDMDALNQKLFTAFQPKSPDLTDVELPQSTRQPMFDLKIIPKNKREARAQEKSGEYTSPGLTAGGHARADGIMAMVGAATIIGEKILESRVQADINLARGQFSAVKKTIDDVQLGLNGNLFNADDLNNLNDFANYILDGKLPTKVIENKSPNGKLTRTEFVDNKKIERFDTLKGQIDQKRGELEKKNNDPDKCVPCTTSGQ